jgi:hypothetical protein
MCHSKLQYLGDSDRLKLSALISPTSAQESRDEIEKKHLNLSGSTDQEVYNAVCSGVSAPFISRPNLQQEVFRLIEQCVRLRNLKEIFSRIPSLSHGCDNHNPNGIGCKLWTDYAKRQGETKLNCRVKVISDFGENSEVLQALVDMKWTSKLSQTSLESLGKEYHNRCIKDAEDKLPLESFLATVRSLAEQSTNSSGSTALSATIWREVFKKKGKTSL